MLICVSNYFALIVAGRKLIIYPSHSSPRQWKSRFMWKTQAAVIGSYGNSALSRVQKPHVHVCSSSTLGVRSTPSHFSAAQWHPEPQRSAAGCRLLSPHTLTVYSPRTENRIGRTAKLISVPQTIDAIYRLFCCCSFLPLERVRGLLLSYPWTNHVWRGADNLTDRFGALCPPRGEREMPACREEFYMEKMLLLVRIFCVQTKIILSYNSIRENSQL